MHFCSDELQVILLIGRDGLEHLMRYAKATVLYVRYRIERVFR